MPVEVPRLDGLAGRRVLVTGAAGFIGSSLCRVLLRSGADVVAYDNLATGSWDNLAGCLEECGADVRRVYGDVRDFEKLARTLPDIEVVYHLACLGVRHSLHSPQENHAVNATGTLLLLEQARLRGVSRVVHVSSSEVYGTARTVPMTEEHPTVPHTVYGASKLAGECYARAFHLSHGCDVVVLRPFNAYGPRSHHEGDSGEVVPRFVVRALHGEALVVFGDGTQTRDLTHVYDSAAAIAAAGVADGVSGGVSGETFNLGSGFEISVNALADLVRQVSGRDVPVVHVEPRPGDVLRLYADSSRAAQALRFQPTVPLADGVTDLVARVAALGPERIGELAAAVRIRNWE